MTAFASKRPFWKWDAFWIVVLPTSLVGVVFVMALLTRVAGA